MKTKYLCAAALIQLVASTLCIHAAENETKPNMIVILVDDMGFSDIGCYGSEIPTPHIDSLAANGVRFAQFYNSARCAPTRASLMTGLHPHQADHATNSGILPKSVVTIPELLKPKGYQTYMTGKWHLNTIHKTVNGKSETQFDPESNPTRRGFDRFYGALAGANPYYKATGSIYEGDEKLAQLPDDWYCTDAYTDKAIEFIKTGDESKPFFLYLAYNAPHWCLEAPKTLVDKYVSYYEVGWDVIRENRMEKQKRLGLFPENIAMSPRDEKVAPWEVALTDNTWAENLLNPPWAKVKLEHKELQDPANNKADWVRRMATYAAVIDKIDQNVGKLTQFLKDQGQLDNTIIMFLSDNGACPEGDRRFGNTLGVLYPWACASNTPYRKYKSRLHEGGIITPFIFSFSKLPRKGIINKKQIAQVKDVMPTLVEVAGGSYPEMVNGHAITPLEGRSFWKSCLDPDYADNAPIHFWEHANNCAVREGKWKALYDTGWVPQDMDVEHRWYLYNLDEDPFETRDVAGATPEVLRSMVEKYNQWAKKVGAYQPKSTKYQ